MKKVLYLLLVMGAFMLSVSPSFYFIKNEILGGSMLAVPLLWDKEIIGPLIVVLSLGIGFYALWETMNEIFKERIGIFKKASWVIYMVCISAVLTTPFGMTLAYYDVVRILTPS